MWEWPMSRWATVSSEGEPLPAVPLKDREIFDLLGFD